METAPMVTIKLKIDSADTIAKMLIGSMMAYNDMAESPKHFMTMLQASIECVEQIIDPSIYSVTAYLELLNMLPEGVVRKGPEHIVEFIRQNRDRFHQFKNFPQ